MNEIYSAKFNQLNERSTNELMLVNFINELVKIFSLKYSNKYKYFSKPVVVKLDEGCYYRLHTDRYAGKIGYTYFINEGWTYDNGGLLNFIDTNSNIYPIIPLSNRIIIRQEENILPHFLSSIEKWAVANQYIIIGWLNDAPVNDGSIVRDYQKLIE
jgi:Rps23 Pro-64 3,4-dihydroxylase Tpa1-like proline 4-hydroxylase